MPEYLAPGVYVEEVDTGAKPIEGVSTSTAGMLGVTERGPVNWPILITSIGEFTHWFGGTLNIRDFRNNIGAHCYLPHAVQGFFTNGGKRVYVTRVLDTSGARNATVNLFGRGDANSANTVLLRAVNERTGTAANLPLIYVLDISDINVNLADPTQNDWIRIGDGSNAEYRQVAALGTAADNTHVSLNFPLSFSHAQGDSVTQILRAEDTTYTAAFSLVSAAQAADTTILVREGAAGEITTLVGAGEILLEIGGANGEYHFVEIATIVAADQARVRLRSPLAMAHPAATTTAIPIQIPTTTPPVINTATLARAPSAGSRMIFVNDRDGDFDDRTTLILIGNATDTTHWEVRRIGDLSQLRVTTGAYEYYAAGSLVEAVTLADDVRTVAAPTAINDLTITLSDASALAVGDSVVVGADVVATAETRIIRTVDTGANQLTFTAALDNAHSASELVQPAAKTSTTAVSAGSRVIALDNRLGLSVGDVIRVGTAPNQS